AKPNFYVLLAQKPNDHMAQFGLGTAFQEEGEFAKAAEQYESALRSVTRAQAMANAKLIAAMVDNLAVCQEQLGKLKAAEGNFVVSLQLDPDYQTYTNLGNLLFRQNRWEEAAAAYSKSLALVRSDGAYHYLAITLEKENKLKEAAEADRQALQI